MFREKESKSELRFEETALVKKGLDKIDGVISLLDVHFIIVYLPVDARLKPDDVIHKDNF